MIESETIQALHKLNGAINEQSGLIAGLQVVIASILKKNPDIVFDKEDVGKMILDIRRGQIDSIDIQKRAREVSHSLSALSERPN